MGVNATRPAMSVRPVIRAKSSAAHAICATWNAARVTRASHARATTVQRATRVISNARAMSASRVIFVRLIVPHVIFVILVLLVRPIVLCVIRAM